MTMGFEFLLHLIEQAWPHSTDGYTYHPPDGKYEFHGDNADRGNWWDGNVDNDGRPKQTPRERQEQQLRDFLQQQALYQAYAKQMELWRLEEFERRIEAAKKDFRGSPLSKPAIPTDLDPAIAAIIEQAEAVQNAAAQAIAKAPSPSAENFEAMWAHNLDDIWDPHDDTWDYAKLAKKEISLLHNKDNDDSAIEILNSADQTLTRTIELMRQRHYETVDNPWPTASVVVASACLPPYAVNLVVAWELFENRRELWQESKKFARLMRDDTPEGVAQLLTFCVELAALHKVTGAMLPVVDAAMPRIKETVSTLVRLAEQERQLAAATGDGLTLTPFNDMLEGMRAAMRVSKEEFLLEAASNSAAEGNSAANSIKQRLSKEARGSSALKQAEEVGEKVIRGTTDIENAVLGRIRTGSATKMDPHHAFPNLVDNYVGIAKKFDIPTKGPGGVIVRQSELYQIEGSLNGASGVFEWIVDQDCITHRRFIPNGGVTGFPNQIPKKS